MKKNIIYVMVLVLFFMTDANANMNFGLINGIQTNNINQVKAYTNPATINSLDMHGNTPLTYALRKQNYYIINLLLYAGADPAIKDSSGNYIFCYAFAGSDPNIRYLFSRYNQKLCSAAAPPPRSEVISSPAQSSSIMSMSTLGIVGGIALVGGGVALAGGGGDDSGGSSGTNNNTWTTEALADYSQVGAVPEQELNSILESEEYLKNEDQNAEMRLGYSFARGYTGKINSVYDTPVFTLNAADDSAFVSDEFVKIAIIDTGVRVTHDDLDDNIIETTHGHTNLAAYYCLTASSCADEGELDDPSPVLGTPYYSHGTMVAGFAAAEDNDFGAVGVAPDAQILPFRAALTSGDLVPYNYIGEAFETSRNEGVFVINNSYGSYATDTTNAAFLNGESLLDMPLSEAQFKLQLHFEGMSMGSAIIKESNFISEMINGAEAGMVFVFAAHNNSYPQPNILSGLPLYFSELQENFITVVNYDNLTGNLHISSNRCGVAKDFCLTAPGSHMFSTHAGGDTSISSGYGTSYAAPVVSGAVAVLKGAFPYLTGDEITSLLFETARDLGEPGVDAVYGHGMLDLERATRPVGSQSIPIDNRLTGTSYQITATSLKLSSGLANSIKKENLNLITLDSYNRAYQVPLNGFIATEIDTIDMKDTLRNFGKKKEQKVQMDQENIVNFHYTTNQNTASDRPHSEAQLRYDDGHYGFNMYLGNNPYNGFMTFNSSSYSSYGLAEAYSRNAFNPYFTANSEDNFGINGYVKINDKARFNFGFLYQNYAMDFDEYNEFNEAENIGSGFGLISGISYDVSENVTTSVEFGLISEKDTLLGTTWDGAFGIGEYNSTYTLSVQADAKFLDDKLSIVGKLNLGYTVANSSQNSLISDIDSISSQSIAIGASYDISSSENKEHSVGFLISQPIQVKSGSFNLNLPVSRDLDGRIYYDSHNIDFSTETETTYQLTYNYQLNEFSFVDIGAMYRDYIQDEFVLMFKFSTSLNN